MLLISQGPVRPLSAFRYLAHEPDAEAAAALSHELSCLTVLADSIPWIDESGISHPWEAITISSLAQVDRSDEVWETGTLGVKAGLAAVCTFRPPMNKISDQGVTDDHSRFTSSAARDSAILLIASTHARGETPSRSSQLITRRQLLLVEFQLFRLDLMLWPRHLLAQVKCRRRRMLGLQMREWIRWCGVSEGGLYCVSRVRILIA